MLSSTTCPVTAGPLRSWSFLAETKKFTRLQPHPRSGISGKRFDRPDRDDYTCSAKRGEGVARDGGITEEFGKGLRGAWIGHPTHGKDKHFAVFPQPNIKCANSNLLKNGVIGYLGDSARHQPTQPLVRLLVEGSQ